MLPVYGDVLPMSTSSAAVAGHRGEASTSHVATEEAGYVEERAGEEEHDDQPHVLSSATKLPTDVSDLEAVAEICSVLQANIFAHKKA